MLAMVEDVSKRLPVNNKRFYASGFSGGARMSFNLAEHLKSEEFAGVLACGAGGRPEKLSSETVVYGLCGSKCFNRWDMACTFKRLRNKDSRLKYFPGYHEWGSDDLVADGISWLNGCYLKNVSSSDKRLVAERDAYAKKVLENIEKKIETEPEWAYERALFLSQFPGPAHITTKAAAHLQSLQKLPKIQLYVKAMADMDRFVNKHFATSPLGYADEKERKRGTKAAEKLAETYKETILHTTFKGMAEPVKTP
jgi:hypothetical protein